MPEMSRLEEVMVGIFEYPVLFYSLRVWEWVVFFVAFRGYMSSLELDAEPWCHIPSSFSQTSDITFPHLTWRNFGRFPLWPQPLLGFANPLFMSKKMPTVCKLIEDPSRMYVYNCPGGMIFSWVMLFSSTHWMGAINLSLSMTKVKKSRFSPYFQILAKTIG